MARKKETVTEWMEESATVRVKLLAGGGKPGFAAADGLAGKTGMEIMHAMLAGVLPYSHMAETLDFALLGVEPGKATFQGTPQLKHYNTMGTVHGGWYATLLDSAVGAAVHSLMPAGQGFTTAELSINIVRAASRETGPLRAIGTVIHCGKQLATAEGRIVGPDGKLYAHATTTCLVFELAGRG